MTVVDALIARFAQTDKAVQDAESTADGIEKMLAEAKEDLLRAEDLREKVHAQLMEAIRMQHSDGALEVVPDETRAALRAKRYAEAAKSLPVLMDTDRS
jgi:hypothetical protein